MKRFVSFSLLALALVCAGGAQANTVLTVPGARSQGSPAYDRSFVQVFGPKKARNVLVLVPGALAGAGQFSLIGPEIVRRVPNLQVWAWDRREQTLIDDLGFRVSDPDRAAAYYLHGSELAGHKFAAVPPEAAAPAAAWGLNVQLADLRAVVLAAGRGGRRRVLLGGEGLGGSTALAYATWDFGGRAGWRDIKGLVLIDGSLMTGSPAPTLAEANGQLASLASGGPFADPLAIGSAPRVGILAELEALYAEKRPAAAAALGGEPALPAALRPPIRVTNQALLGYDFDASSAPAALAPLFVHSGTLSAGGDPRPWRNLANTPISRLVRLFRSPHATEWYFPRRLAIDLAAVDPLQGTAATRQLGLRALHAREVAVPIFAFESEFGRGVVNAGARRFVRVSRVPRALFVAAHGFSALDSLAAMNSRNYLLRSLVPFLKRGQTR